ncbi:MAG: hypothetical protein J6S67_24245 [Methanobrevibacter sp.]|nr:hypothetical protein [Methanobrevibacter sp.]
MDENRIDQDELESSENVDENIENNEIDEAAAVDPGESEEEQEETSAEMIVQETISISLDDVPMDASLNDLGLMGLGVLIIIFFLATMAVLGKE